MMTRATAPVHLLATFAPADGSRRTRPACCGAWMVAAAVFTLAGCSSDPTGGCPVGTVFDPATSTCLGRGGDEDTGRGGSDDTSDVDTSVVEDTTAPDIGGCVPNAIFCVDPTTSAVCDGTGDNWTTAPCEDDRICEGGACVAPPESCEPGEALGCDTPTSRRVCGEDGLPRTEDCPSSATNCVDGACTDQICSPGTRRCDGPDVVECSDDGRSLDPAQVCEFGCAGGRCVDPCAGDSKDYLGCTFWAADLDNDTGSGADVADFGFTVSNATSSDVSVEVTRGDGSEVSTVVIGAGALETVIVPPQNVNDTGVSFSTYRIASDAPVTVHQFNPLNNVSVFSNDASLLLPATSVGTDYIVVGWPSTGGGALKSFVAIVAVGEGETEVSVTSPIAALPGGSVLALEPGVEQRVRLQQGQILSYSTSDPSPVGFTGMEISATQPVSVFSGSECANVPDGTSFCDHLEQQLFPVDTWGTEFVGAKFSPRGDEDDVWRVVASENGTTIRTNPAIPTVDGRTLGRGEYVEFITKADFVLTADRPVSLAQFMVGSAYPGADNGCDLSGFEDITWGCAIPRTCSGGTGIGDPAFLIDVPTAQFREDYIVLTPADYTEDYFTIITRPGTSIRMDGVEVTAERDDIGGWQIIRVPASDGIHAVNADGPIGLYAYGYDCDVSYAYPGGLNLESL